MLNEAFHLVSIFEFCVTLLKLNMLRINIKIDLILAIAKNIIDHEIRGRRVSIRRTKVCMNFLLHFNEVITKLVDSKSEIRANPKNWAIF